MFTWPTVLAFPSSKKSQFDELTPVVIKVWANISFHIRSWVKRPTLRVSSFPCLLIPASYLTKPKLAHTPYLVPLPISLIRCFTLHFFILVGISSSWVRQNKFTEKAVLQYTHLTHITSKERNRYRRRVKVSDTCFPYSFPIAYRYYFQETHSLLVISYLVEWKESDWKQ